MVYSKKLSDGMRVPSHTELYRDFERIENYLLKEIFDQMEWQIETETTKTHYSVKGTCPLCKKEANLLFLNENDNIEYEIRKYEKRLHVYVVCSLCKKTSMFRRSRKHRISEFETTKKNGTTYSVQFEEYGWDIIYTIGLSPELPENYQIYIEYKSSEQEWGKQFDAYIRQMKKRISKIPSSRKGKAVLMSFDPRLKGFDYAAKRSGFVVVALGKDMLAKLEGQQGLKEE